LSVPEWFRDRAVRKVAKHGIPVALGKIATAASGLITLAILARYLGPERFGVIALFRTVVTMVDLFANFNTWQAVIKYGTEAIANDRRDSVRQVIKLAFVIDLSTAIVGTFVVAGLAFAIPGSFGWTMHESLLCTVFAATLVTKVSGTSDGIFRICDAYRVQGIVGSVMAGVMTLIVAIAVLLGASFDGCVLALVVGEVLSNVVMTMTSFWVARNSGYGGWGRTPLSGLEAIFPGIKRFLLATNAQLTVRTAQGEVDMIVVGSTLGKASAGLFRVIKQLGTIPGRIFNPFEAVLFTELARCSATKDYAGFRSLLRRTVAISGTGSFLIWIAAAVFSEQLIELIAGHEFVAAAQPFRIYLFAMILQVVGMPILRAMIALGRPGTLFIFDSASLIVLACGAITGAALWGLSGIAAAIVVHKAIQVTWSATFIWRFLRNAEAQAARAP
jgi:O-antigen/teichoic acid export membrane protein